MIERLKLAKSKPLALRGLERPKKDTPNFRVASKEDIRLTKNAILLQTDFVTWSKFIAPIFDEFEPLAEVEIQEIEKSISVNFPEDYRSFLKTYGYSAFSEEAYICESDDRKYDVMAFFGSKHSQVSLLDEWEEDRQFENLRLIPIACDFSGNLFLFNIDADFQVGFVKRGPFHTEFEPIADSFSKFMNRFTFEIKE